VLPSTAIIVGIVYVLALVTSKVEAKDPFRGHLYAGSTVQKGAAPIVDDLGWSIESLESDIEIFSFARQADGKTLVAGRKSSSYSDDMAVIRYLGDGSRDGSFGQAGLVGADFYRLNDVAKAIIVRPSGHICLVGTSCSKLGVCSLVAAQFTPYGEWDETFANRGRLVTQMSGLRPHQLKVESQDGRLILSGIFCTSSNKCQELHSVYNSDGTAHPTIQLARDRKRLTPIMGPIRSDGSPVLAAPFLAPILQRKPR